MLLPVVRKPAPATVASCVCALKRTQRQQWLRTIVPHEPSPPSDTLFAPCRRHCRFRCCWEHSLHNFFFSLISIGAAECFPAKGCNWWTADGNSLTSPRFVLSLSLSLSYFPSVSPLRCKAAVIPLMGCTRHSLHFFFFFCCWLMLNKMALPAWCDMTVASRRAAGRRYRAR